MVVSQGLAQPSDPDPTPLPAPGLLAGKWVLQQMSSNARPAEEGQLTALWLGWGLISMSPLAPKEHAAFPCHR